MSFTSLLSQISKDRKLQEKAKTLALSNPTTKVSSSLSNINTNKLVKTNNKNNNNNSNNQTKDSQSSIKNQVLNLKTKLPHYSNNNNNNNSTDDDAAVRRLKEARRKEREKLQAQKDIKKISNPKSSKSKTSSISISTSKPNTIKSSRSKITSSPTTNKQQNNTIPLKSTKSRFKNKIFSQNANNISYNSENKQVEPKLSFKELMKQAESIDKQPSLTSLPFTTIKKPLKKEPSKAYQSIQKSRNQSVKDSPSALSSRRFSTSPQPILPPPKTSKIQNLPKGPKSKMSQLLNLPPKPLTRTTKTIDDRENHDISNYKSPSFAKPNPELLNKLKKRKTESLSREQRARNNRNNHLDSTKKVRKLKSYDDIDAVGDDDDDEFDDYDDYDRYGDDYDSQDDGFIVDDEEDDELQSYLEYKKMNQKEKERQMKSQGYSRDEIWSIFNRGKKRNYNDRDNYDSDEMEATGTEILEEEERTLKQAKLDDQREQRLLEKRAAEKRQRLNR